MQDHGLGSLRRRASLAVRAALPADLRHRLRPLVGRIRDLRPGIYSNADEELVIARLLDNNTAARYCVDIAASDGRTMSNTLALYEQGWAGLSVEMDGDLFKALARRHASFPGSVLFRGRVTPDNVLDLLRAAGTPASFGFLNLDIDGYDFYVLERVLSAFHPALICAEINEKVPPPLRFTVNYDPDHVSGGSHFYGQSICQLELLCERHEYAIVELEYNNAFLMPMSAAPRSLRAAEAYRLGYAQRPDRRERFPWNDDMEPLQSLPPAAAVDFLNRAFAPHRGRYSLDAGIADQDG